MSAASVSKSFPLPSPLKVEDYRFDNEGIISILDSHSRIKIKDSTLRRTLSADMSSNMWLAQNGFSVSAMKRIPSHQDFRSSGYAAAGLSSLIEGKEDACRVKNGVGVPNQSGALKEGERAGQIDIWSSILSQNAQDSSNLPPPYAHPLVKRSASSLSKKSLEICTESLGSETGSDGFSSYASSEIDDVEDGGETTQKRHPHHQQQQQQEKEYFQSFDMEDFQVAKYKKSPRRSFPPPLLSRSRCDGASLQMQSYKKDGRLVLEAFSIPQQNYFHTQRSEGRLVLTLVNEENGRDKAEEFEQVFDETEEEEEDKEMEFVMEPTQKLTALMMTKFIALKDRNNRWPHKFNKAVDLEEEEEEQYEKTPVSQSLPPAPRVARLIPLSATAAAASLNAYEYFWKTKQPAAVSAGIIYPLSAQKCPPFKNTSYCNKAANILLQNSPKITSFEQKQDLVATRNNNNNGVLSGCKDSRRSQLGWEACCIATS